jgi:hypothetical protein
MTLLDFQRRMAADVSRPLTADFAMQPAEADGSSVASRVATYVKANDRLSSFERLEIYNRQYWFRLIAAVSEDYPALNAIVGAKRFDALILAYLEQNPSRSYTLRDLGAGLPGWLGDHPEFSGAHHELAVDVARLEWAYLEAFDSAAVAPLDETHVARLQPTTVLSLQPHLQLLELRFAADEIVLAVHKEKTEADIVSNAVVERRASKRVRLPKPKRGATYLVVHRYQESVYYRCVDRETFGLLSAIQAGEPLAVVVEKAFCESSLSPSEQGRRIQECFAHAAELGWLTASMV